MSLKPIEAGIKQVLLACDKVAELNDDGVTYTCLHCRAVIGSKEEPPDCKDKREKAEPIKGDWWLMADEDVDGKQT